MQFKDIIGQTTLSNQLTSIIDSGHISHSQLFTGTPANGSMAIAVAYVQYLFCSNRQHFHNDDAPDELHADSCGTCPSCRKIAELSHPDLHLFFPSMKDKEKEAPSSATQLQKFRDFMLASNLRGDYAGWCNSLQSANSQGLIRESDAAAVLHQLSLTSYEGGYRAFIVWGAEMMNNTFANALLKSFEEPLGDTLFILVTNDAQNLLETVRSRMQEVNIPPIASTLSSESTNSEQENDFASKFIAWMRQLVKINMLTLSAWVDSINDMPREQQLQYLNYCQKALESCLMHTLAAQPLSIDFGDSKFNNSFPAMITPNNIAEMCEAFNQASNAISHNSYSKITFMELSFTISKLLRRR